MPRRLHLLLIAPLLLAASSRNANAQNVEPSREPILRVEIGRHTAPIRGISTDARNRFLVTASDDKTARVWELATGRLLRVLRPYIGAAVDGKLLAVALSPDGSTVAASGWTDMEREKANSIYLFDRESGRLLRRIAGIPDFITHLVYSPDGRWLAATTSDRHGVRLYETSSYRQVGKNSDCDGYGYRSDFDSRGQIVTSCSDGAVRLYQLTESDGLRLKAKRTVPSGSRPVGVSFAPDGGKIAVGFRDSTRVVVLSANDLTTLYEPKTAGADGSTFWRVAWSADGRRLYAGGGYPDGGKALIREWADAGLGDVRDSRVATGYVWDFIALRDGGLAYATNEPSWGRLDAEGRRVVLSGEDTTNYSPPSDYCALRSRLQLSTDGTYVQYPWWKTVMGFSVLGRQLQPELAATAQLNSPLITGLNITDWCGKSAPKLNGKLLQLQVTDESSQSLAIAPDRSRFALGTELALYLFDRNGRRLWLAGPLGETTIVNVSGDGRFVVAGSTDSIIRWHRMADGKELLALFPHPDGKRWVLWTPSGYYDASPGAEELIGWHVNNGRGAAADFFPVGQFRSVYYRPDVVSKILQAGDEQSALREANEEAGRKQQQAALAQMLPPVVEIVSPADGAEVASGEIAVRFRLRTPSGEPVTEVRALVDGRPAGAERGLALKAAAAPGESKAAGERELKVSVPEGESQVSVIASNRFTTSVPATVRVRFRKAAASPAAGASAKPAAAEAFEIKPKLYVLAVGVSNYADPKLKLGFAAKDAGDFAAAMSRQKGGLYRDVVVRLLTDERASKDEVLDGLDWIRKETTSKDVAMVLLAGHGLNDQNGRYFYLPHNADLEKLLRTGVSFEDIKNTVSALAGKTLFFIDTCHSGNVLATRRALGLDIMGVVNELSSAENGAVVFAASTGNQYSLENPSWRNGAFTLAVVEGFDGRADYTGRGRITINMLDLYISERVKELTGGRQTPTTAKPNTVPDFPVALRK
jgi:WD40 repeat protein